MNVGQALECNDCEDRKESAGYYCDFCPHRAFPVEFTGYPEPREPPAESEPPPVPATPQGRFHRLVVKCVRFAQQR
jgi:hypothetical protein